MSRNALRFAFLGSGSKGNCALVESRETCLMLDCGFSARETLVRLQRLGREISDVNAILITHEHSDHINGAASLARKYGIPVWMTQGTYTVVDSLKKDGVNVNFVQLEKDYVFQDIEVRTFPVPHDAREPSQYVFSNGDHRLGILTDTGSLTPCIESHLDDCDALVIECNHDRRMLLNGSYPASLKARVGGPHGHLDNHTAAELLTRISTDRLQHVVAAHLSDKNNLPSLAKAALCTALGCSADEIEVADQEDGLSWLEVA